MRRMLTGALAGTTAGAAVVLFEVLLRSFAGVSTPAELGADRTLPLLSVNQFDQLLGLAGGPILAKELAFWGGFAGVVVAGAVAGAVWSRLRLRPGGGRIAVAVLVVMAGAIVVGLWPVLDSSYVGLAPEPATAVTVAVVVLTVALAAGSLKVLATAAEAPSNPGRRQLLIGGAGLALLAVTGGLAERLFSAGAFGYDGMRLLPHGGARAPITPVADFYAVTKNLVDPYVNPDLWRLEVTGDVAKPYQLTLQELRTLGSATQETTLECISNGVGYGLLSNGLWGGVPLATLLDRARPGASARNVLLEGADGYLYSLPLQQALSGTVFVAHSLNGQALTQRHGAPARAIVPGKYGEASAKWLTRITLSDTHQPGYYEQQGWQADYVHTTSVIDFPQNRQTVPAGQPMTVRGVAFAGDRGVSKLELSPDGGLAWLPARLDYAASPLAWALWSVAWTPPRTGTTTLLVRAYDGAGNVQEEVRHGTVPAGATGFHQVEVRVV
jgi:DMSO/TMAO reductase YedYZ molybdopterin-dependent catalytic subunit